MRCRFFTVLCAPLAFAGCQGMLAATPAVPGALATAADRSVSARISNPSSGSLYVGDLGTQAVTVYALNAGVPLSTPVRTLNVGLSILSLAVGSDGTTYVGAESFSGPDEVAVYAPGAQGSEPPERVLYLPGAPWALAVDAAGYVYAGLASVAVDVYLPGASGYDQPIATIGDSSFIGGLALDAAGDLYVADGLSGLTEYATPTSNPTPIRNTCFIVKRTLNGVAVAATGTTFVAVDDARHHPHHSFIVPVDTHEYGCPVRHRRRIYAEPVFHNPIGIAEQNGRLYVADPSFGEPSRPAIVVINADARGRGSPLYVLRGSQLQHPRGVALGP